jgi:hypothetical protein
LASKFLILLAAVAAVAAVPPGALSSALVASFFASSFVACGQPGSGVPPHSDAGPSAVRESDVPDSDVSDSDVPDSDVSEDVPQVFPEAGVPFLESLTVTSAADVSAIVLTPAFSPDTFDYYVSCAAGSNALAVTATAGEGATVAIDVSATTFQGALSQQSSGFAASQNLSSLPVNAGQAVVAVVESGGATSQYWVRCLPNDMPGWSWSLHPENGALPSGYFLVGDLYPNDWPGTTAYAVVFDENGVPVWFEPASPAGYGAGGVDSPSENFVSYLNFYNEGVGPFTLFNLSSWTTTVVPNSTAWDQYQVNLHELKYYPETGNYLVIGQPTTYGVDLTGVQIGGTSMVGGPDGAITDCAILEISPSDGSVVNSWLASEHFITKEVTTTPYEYGTAADGGTIVDAYHCNAIDIDPANNNLLISMRNANTVIYMTWPEGNILWKMGGVNQSNNNAPFVTVSSPFVGQHDARLRNWNQSCNGGAGQITMFDDETGGTLGAARGIIYDVVVGSGDSTCADAGTPGMATVAWQYSGVGQSGDSGSMRELLGATDPLWVIGWGVGVTPYVFSVIDQVTNEDLLDFAYTDSEPSYRAIPKPISNFDLNLLRETAGLTIPNSTFQ